MVICDDLKLAFIEIPNTGCTAVRKTLVENYGGRGILHKHAIYYELRRELGSRINDFQVFATVRSPLDTILTQFRKLETQHKERFTEPERRQHWSLTSRHWKMHRDVEDGMSFSDFLTKYFARIYHNYYLVGTQHASQVMRYSSLQDDFRSVLQMAGVTEPVEIAVANQTSGKPKIESAYGPSIRDHVVRVFGPFMHQWGLEFPGSWNVADVPSSSMTRYRYTEKVVDSICRYGGLSPNGSPRWIQRAREVSRRVTG
ncbi:MAG: sulfotransferase family 2 domain-containing protein [Planctomycetota bacterium]